VTHCARTERLPFTVVVTNLCLSLASLRWAGAQGLLRGAGRLGGVLSLDSALSRVTAKHESVPDRAPARRRQKRPL